MIEKYTSYTVIDDSFCYADVSSGTTVKAYSGGLVSACTFSGREARLEVGVSGFAEDIKLKNHAFMFVTHSGRAERLAIYDKASCTIDIGGCAESATIHSGGALYVNDYGYASKTYINRGGSMFVHNVADDVTVSGGYMALTWSGKTSGIVASDASIVIYRAFSEAHPKPELRGGRLFKTNTSAGGLIADSVMLGGSCGVEGSASSMLLENGAVMHVYSGGTATDIRVGKESYLIADSGAVISKITVLEGGRLVTSENTKKGK